MDNEFEFEEEHDPAETGYYIEFEGETIVFSWANSRVLKFIDQIEPSPYDHVEHYTEDKTRGIFMNSEAVRFLLDHNFPHLFSPTIDDDNREWVEHMLSRDIDEITPEMFGETDDA